MSPDHSERLDKIEFPWSETDADEERRCEERWKQRYEELRAFHERFGHCNVPQRFAENEALAAWAAEQRRMYFNAQLSPDHKRHLESLAFTQSMRDRSWDFRYGELKAFKEKFGHCNVPGDFEANPRLAEWVTLQRGQFSRGQLECDQVHRLETLGLTWSLHQRSWEKRYEELKAFKEKFGHCNVPQKYEENPPLAAWIRDQRRAKENGLLPADRVRRLDTLGFQWTHYRTDAGE